MHVQGCFGPTSATLLAQTWHKQSILVLHRKLASSFYCRQRQQGTEVRHHSWWQKQQGKGDTMPGVEVHVYNSDAQKVQDQGFEASLGYGVRTLSQDTTSPVPQKERKSQWVKEEEEEGEKERGLRLSIKGTSTGSRDDPAYGFLSCGQQTSLASGS